MVEAIATIGVAMAAMVATTTIATTTTAAVATMVAAVAMEHDLNLVVPVHHFHGSALNLRSRRFVSTFK